ncbi:serine hydrolase domain-containing protein [Streptomyces violascens]|uniref:serine hydrolase domain-containing protein n=1 Tax=Streptomyces violascens TaxID=67381 RepID=UPI0037B72EA4
MAVRTVRRVRTAILAAVLVGAVTATAFVAPASAQQAHPTAPAYPTDHRATQRAMDAAVAAGVPGVIGVAEDGRGRWTGEAGVADTRTGRERRAQDTFRVGSLTKTFVSTVLLQLEAEGRLSLDDSVDTWLPGLVRGNGNDGRAITLRQLLNHTSGIYNYTADPDFQRLIFGPGFFEHRYDTWTPERLVRTALAHRPDFAPGTSWKYSNTNYILAGMVIQKVTGRSYAQEAERRILRPLNLRSTSFPGTDARMPQPSGRAYSTLGGTPDRVYDVTELNPSAAGSAGEVVSDSLDLNRFYRALLGGKLLPPRQLAEMTTTVPSNEIPNASYGLGLMKVTLSCGTEVWGHSGGIHGSTSQAVVTKDAGHSLAFNFNGDWTGDSTKVIEAEFCGAK